MFQDPEPHQHPPEKQLSAAERQPPPYTPEHQYPLRNLGNQLPPFDPGHQHPPYSSSQQPPAPVQHPLQVTQNQSTTVVEVPTAETRPQSYLGFSIFSCLCCNRRKTPPNELLAKAEKEENCGNFCEAKNLYEQAAEALLLNLNGKVDSQSDDHSSIRDKHAWAMSQVEAMKRSMALEESPAEEPVSPVDNASCDHDTSTVDSQSDDHSSIRDKHACATSQVVAMNRSMSLEESPAEEPVFPVDKSSCDHDTRALRKEEPETPVLWNQVLGLEDVKHSLREHVVLPLKFPQLFFRKPLTNVLLYGYAGVGKTMLVKALARETGLPVLSLHCWTLDWNSDACSRRIKALFKAAHDQGPCIVLLEDVDVWNCEDKKYLSGGAAFLYSKAKAELLIQMALGGPVKEGVRVFGTTQYPMRIDPAVRKGFVKRYHIPLPGAEARSAMLTQLFTDTSSQYHVDLSREELRTMVDKTEGFSMEDMTIVMRDALMQPVRRLFSSLHPSRETEDPTHSSPAAAVHETPCSSLRPHVTGANGPSTSRVDRAGVFKSMIEKWVTNKNLLVSPDALPMVELNESVAEKRGENKRRPPEPLPPTVEDIMGALKRVKPTAGPKELKEYDQFTQQFT